jgi:pSer/pThr/pTyr-binding forkhead associated (FHA) protein
MDHAHPPAEAADHLPLVQGPQLRLCSQQQHERPANFVPLRLVLPHSGAVIEVDRPDMLVGRHTDADVRLPLPDVSRRHCRLQWIEGGWQVIDLNSLNGIHVNGEQVIQSPLLHGDLLRIGGFLFTIELTGSAGASGSAERVVKTISSEPLPRAS